MQILHYHRTAK